jgi:hypothetical protein
MSFWSRVSRQLILKADIGVYATNSHFVRIADLDGDRRECRLSAHHVEMCMA